MSKRKKAHRPNLPELLENYANPRCLDYYHYSPFHMRLIDPGYTTIDCWTTGKYYVKETNYYLQTERKIIERGAEQGVLPGDDQLEQWLDELFYIADMEEQ